MKKLFIVFCLTVFWVQGALAICFIEDVECIASFFVPQKQFLELLF